jgi:hypothetical protein
MPIKLENWYMKFNSRWSRDRKICGNVYDHPAHKDGNLVTISTVKHINGKTLTTINESVYILGQPKKEYIDFLKENNYDFDPENPVKFVEQFTNLSKKNCDSSKDEA